MTDKKLKLFLTLRDMDEDEYYCVKQVELTPELEEKIAKQVKSKKRLQWKLINADSSIGVGRQMDWVIKEVFKELKN